MHKSLPGLCSAHGSLLGPSEWFLMHAACVVRGWRVFSLPCRSRQDDNQQALHHPWKTPWSELKKTRKNNLLVPHIYWRYRNGYCWMCILFSSTCNSLYIQARERRGYLLRGVGDPAASLMNHCEEGQWARLQDLQGEQYSFKDHQTW